MGIVCCRQGWEFALLLIRSFLFCSKSFILKDDLERFAHVALYKIATESDSLAKNEWIARKIRIFHMFLTVFHFIMPKSESSPLSRFTKERQWAICSGGSWQKIDCELFAQVTHDKRATGAIRSFSKANHSFVHKKRGNCLKYGWSNSQPWLQRSSIINT